MAYEPYYRPKLRYVEAFPMEHQGKKGVLLRDPLGYSEHLLFLAAPLAPVLSMMDGRHTLRDIQTAMSRMWGRIVVLEEISQLVASLEESLLLDSPRFWEAKKQLEDDFFRMPIRPAAHAGQAYPAQAKEAQKFREEILRSYTGSYEKRVVQALIAPHIDLRAGARCFAAAYNATIFPPGARVVILGTGHFLESAFSVLPKPFETPWRNIPVDLAFIEDLRKEMGTDIYRHFWAHRLEHSIEFQVFFLELFADIKIVPILCGSPETPDNKRELEKLAKSLGKLRDAQTFFIAGVDFCHLGLRYGDSLPAQKADKEKALNYDRMLLQKVLDLDAQGFYQTIMESNNNYRICGFGPLFVLLKALEGRPLKGEILYQGVVDFDAGSIVSVAAARLFER